MRFRSDPASIRGSIAPVITPFTPAGDVDLDAVRSLVEWQLANGTHGISVGGSTGEPSTLSLDERESIMAATAEAIDGRVPFLPGAGSTHLDETLRLVATAERLGADAALVISPYYSRPTQEGLFQWYSTVAREFPSLPIVIYNVPVRTAVDVAPETVARLRRAHDNVVGIKETTKDFEHVSKVFHACGRDVLVWCGIELLCLPALALGAIGTISAVTNIAPRASAELFEAFDRGDHERALELHYALHPLAEMIFVETNPGPLKWALEHLGVLPSAYVRPPLVSPGESSQAKILELLEASRPVLVSHASPARPGGRAMTTRMG
jgi:4-hydroxy-tetrahydrodipicolinate synthase